MNPGYLADAIVLIHVIWVLCIIVPVPLFIIGNSLNWKWIRLRWMRLIHLAMMGIVAMETVFGMACPLTVIEQDLRQAAGSGQYSRSFIGQILHNLLFFDFAPWVFALVYLAFFLLIIFLYFMIPPKKRQK